MLTATVHRVQCYCVVFEFVVVTAILDIVQLYCVFVEYVLVSATVDIVKLYCFVCGDYCGYCNSRYSAMVLCCVWSLLWLQQQMI